MNKYPTSRDYYWRLYLWKLIAMKTKNCAGSHICLPEWSFRNRLSERRIHVEDRRDRESDSGNLVSDWTSSKQMIVGEGKEVTSLVSIVPADGPCWSVSVSGLFKYLIKHLDVVKPIVLLNGITYNRISHLLLAQSYISRAQNKSVN